MIYTTKKTIDDYGLILDENAVQLEGLDDCICGVVERFGMERVLLYDTNRIIEKMVEEDGMTHFEALEFFDFNILGAWFGDGTPCFTSFLEEE